MREFRQRRDKKKAPNELRGLKDYKSKD